MSTAWHVDDDNFEPCCAIEQADATAFELHHNAFVHTYETAVVFDLDNVAHGDAHAAIWRHLRACADNATAQFLSHGRYDDPMMDDATLWFSLYEAVEGLSQMAPQRLRQRFYFVVANVASLYGTEFANRASQHPAFLGECALTCDSRFRRTVKFCAVPLTEDPMLWPKPARLSHFD